MVLVKEKEVEAALVKRTSFFAFVLRKWYSVLLGVRKKFLVE